MKREIREKRKKIYLESKRLREIAYLGSTFEKAEEIRKEQDDLYKKSKFYDGIIKAMEKGE